MIYLSGPDPCLGSLLWCVGGLHLRLRLPFRLLFARLRLSLGSGFLEVKYL